MTAKIQGMSDIRRFFCRNETPIFFISATNFNLMGIDDWVRNFKFISFIDCYDGRHPHYLRPGCNSSSGVLQHRGHQQLPPRA